MQSKNDKLKLYICLAGLLAMFAIEVLSGRLLNEYIHTFWIAGFTLFLPYESIIYLITFIVPLSSLFSHFAHVFLVVFIVILLKKYVLQKHSVANMGLFFIVIFSLWEFLAYVNYGAATINKILGYVTTICLLFWVLYEKKHGNYKEHLRIYIFAVFVLCFLTLANTAIVYQGNWFADFLKGGMRLGGTANSEFSETDVALNANTVAYYSIVAISCYLSMWGLNKNTSLFIKIFEIVEVTLIAVVGMLTVSRSWLLLMAGIIVLFYIGRLIADKKTLNRNIPLLIGIFVIILVFSRSSFMQNFAIRFSGESVETGGGRIDLLKKYFELFFANPQYTIFGTGVTNYSSVLGTKISMHNGTQQILVCLGIPMAILFLSSLLIPIYNAKEKKRTQIQNWLPLIAVIMFVQTIQFLNPNTFMLAYIVGLYSIKLQTNKN